MAGRTFFIPKSTSTTSLADMPNDDLDTPITPAPLPTVSLPSVADKPQTAALTEILGESSSGVGFHILRSFVSSLNLMLVNRCRRIVNNVPTRTDHERPAVDTRNEDDDALGANSGCYDQGSLDEAQAHYAGQKTEPSDRDVASALGVIRAYVHWRQREQHGERTTPFTPRSLWESIQWLESQQPPDVTPESIQVQTVVAAMQGLRTPEQVAIDINTQLAADRELFKSQQMEIVAMGDMFTESMLPDEQEVEAAFDRLPLQVRLNVYTAALNACSTAFSAAYKRLTRRGEISAGGDMVIARNLYERANRTLQQMLVKHAAEAAELEDRGVVFKAVKPLI